MISKWNYLPLTSEEQELEIELAKKFAGSPAIAELLVQRGITTVEEAEHFFNPSPYAGYGQGCKEAKQSHRG